MKTKEFVKFAVTYSGRNLWRSRRRSSLLIATVVLAVAVSIIAKSYADEIFTFWVASATESGVGDAQLHKLGFDEETSLNKDVVFYSGDAIETELAKDSNVLGFARRLSVEGLISKGSRSIYFSGMGIEPGKESIVSPQLLGFEGSKGRFIKADQSNGIVIGRGLAESLGVDINDSVTLSVQSLANNLNALDVIVVGILNFPDTRVSKRLLYMNLGSAQTFMQAPDAYSEVAIKLKQSPTLEGWSAKTRSQFEDLGARLKTWWDIFPPMKKVEVIWKSVIGVICALLFLSACLSVLNVIFIAVGERTIEIGILMALGSRAKDMRQIVAIEALLVGGLGGAVGWFLGNMAVLILGRVGLPLANPFFEGFIFVYPSIQVIPSLMIAMIALVICYLAAIFPAIKAAKIEPVVAFRGQV